MLQSNDSDSEENRQAQLDELVERIGSVDGLRKLLTPSFGANALQNLSSQMDECIVIPLMRQECLKILKIFLDIQRWEQLAKDPKRFEIELNSTLATIKRLMKVSYRIPSHCPKKNALRDREISDLRRQGRSFGQIGRKFGISDKRAERACKRHEEAEKERVFPKNAGVHSRQLQSCGSTRAATTTKA